MGIKVGVLTFHNYDNYGAILQSYALQKRLLQIGADPEIIDYNCDYISNPFRLVNLKEKGLFNYIYGAIGHICYIPRRRGCNLFRRRMRYSSPVDRAHLAEVADKYDIYLVGSDQIWDYKLTNFDKTYFLDFVADGKKKVSYAASIGEHVPPKGYREEYSRLLKGFDRILIRESYGAKIVEELTGERPECACDPTLLLTAREWAKISVQPKEKEKYILVYQLGINRELVAFARRLQKETGCRVVYVPFPLGGYLKCSMKIALDPCRWIGLFQNAEYVVSDSFHGAVFALLFNRRFFVMTNGHHRNRRIEELLDRVGLSGRTIDGVSDGQLMEEIDFTFANEQLARMRRESLENLKNIILGGNV